MAGNFDFVVVSTHMRWDDKNSEGRKSELQMLADWLDEKRKDATSEDKNLIVMGDFNIGSREDDFFKAITGRGLPKSLQKLQFGTNLAKNKRYDQILHYPISLAMFKLSSSIEVGMSALRIRRCSSASPEAISFDTLPWSMGPPDETDRDKVLPWRPAVSYRDWWGIVKLCKGARMNHLERLIYQYYEWQGYIVRANTLVGRRAKGGYDCELDIVAYHPETEHLLHVEPSLDADTWDKREKRFTKKFLSGQKHIKTDVLPWLADSPVEIEQVAVLISSVKNYPVIGGGKVVNLDEFTAQIKGKVCKRGVMVKNAIPERYDLLRTI